MYINQYCNVHHYLYDYHVPLLNLTHGKFIFRSTFKCNELKKSVKNWNSIMAFYATSKIGQSFSKKHYWVLISLKHLNIMKAVADCWKYFLWSFLKPKIYRWYGAWTWLRMYLNSRQLLKRVEVSSCSEGTVLLLD